MYGIRRIFIDKIKFILVFLLFILIEHVVCIRVYSTLPQIEIKTKSLFNLTLTKSEMHASYPGFIFLTFGASKFAIIDILNSDYNIVTSRNGTFVNVIIKPNFMYFHLYNDTIQIMKFDIKRKILNSVNQYQPGIIINCMEVDNNEQYIFLAQNALLHVVDMSSKLNPKLFKTLGQKFKAETAQISIKFPYLIFQNKNRTMSIFNINNQINDMKHLMYINLTYPSYFATFMDYEDDNYLYSYSKYNGIITYNFTLLYKNEQEFVTQMKNESYNSFLINVQRVFETVNHILISPTFKQLILAVRSNGIYIYQQFQQKKLDFIQQIKSPNLASYVSFIDLNENYLLLSDGLSLKFFIAQEYGTTFEPNYINIFNLKQNSMMVDEYIMDQQQDKGNIAYDESTNLIFISNSTNILVYNNDFLVPKQYRKSEDNVKKVIYFLYLEIGFLIAARESIEDSSINEISFYKIKDIPIDFKPDLSIPCQGCEFSSLTTNYNQQLLFVINIDSIIIYDISFLDNGIQQYEQPTLLLNFFPPKISSNNQLSYLVLHKDDTMGFYIFKGQAFIFFRLNLDKINKSASIDIIKTYITQDIEILAYDIRDYNYLFLSGGLNGIQIYDCSDVSSSLENNNIPVFLKQVDLKGQVTNFHQSPSKPNLLIVNQVFSAQIVSLIRIEDVKEAVKMFEFNLFADEYIYQTLYYNNIDDTGFLAFSTNKGLRYCLIIKTINLYYYMQKQSEINTISFNQNDNTSMKRLDHQLSGRSNQADQQFNIQIHDISEIRLTPIYSKMRIKFNKIFLHQNFILQSPPSWIQYDEDELLIKIQPPKESQILNSGEIVIILQIFLSISPQFFENTFFISTEMSKSLYELFIEYQLIDNQGMFLKRDLYSVKYLEQKINAIIGNNTSPQQIKFIQQMIPNLYSQLEYFFPIQFKVVSSLKFDIHSDDILTSLDNQCKMKIQINKNSNLKIKLFTNSSYSALLISFSEDRSEMNLDGNKYDINTLIKYNFFYGIDYNKTLLDLNPTITFNVFDSFNYPNVQSMKMIDIPNLHQINGLKVGESLQSQYEDIYSTGLTINTPYSISFSKQSFQNSGLLQIKYSAFLVEDKEQDTSKRQICITDCNFYSWIRFDPDELRIHGDAGFIRYRNSYLILIIAEDEFGRIHDYCEIQFNHLPIELILILSFFSILTLILIILIYLFRKRIQKFTSFYQYSYQRVEVQIKKQYYKCIVCTPYSLKYARLMFNLLKKDYLSNLEKDKNLIKKCFGYNNQSNKAKFALFFSDDNGSINMSKVIERALHIYKANKSIFPNLHLSSITSKDTNFRNALFSLISFELISTSKQSKLFEQIKKNVQKKYPYSDWYRVIQLNIFTDNAYYH